MKCKNANIFTTCCIVTNELHLMIEGCSGESMTEFTIVHAKLVWGQV